MDRRTFVVTAVAMGVAAAAASAQQASTMPRIALYDWGASPVSMTEDGHPYWGALLRELRRLGYVAGKTITIDRWSGGGRGVDEVHRQARNIVDTQPDLIVPRGTIPIKAFMAATTKIPIVGIGTFPADSYASLARPGGNITGIEGSLGAEFYAKLIELLHDAVPTASRIAWLGTQDTWDLGHGLGARLGAEKLSLTLSPVFVDFPVNEAAIRQAFDSMTRQGFDALYISPTNSVYVHHRLVAELATAAHLPAAGRQRQYAESGLLMTYGPIISANFERAAWYVDQILKGANPADMPIEQPTKIEFIVNLKTARELGIALPPSIMIRATKIIE